MKKILVWGIVSVILTNVVIYKSVEWITYKEVFDVNCGDVTVKGEGTVVGYDRMRGQLKIVRTNGLGTLTVGHESFRKTCYIFQYKESFWYTGNDNKKNK